MIAISPEHGAQSLQDGMLPGHLASTPFHVRDIQAFAEAFRSSDFSFGSNIGLRILDRARNFVAIVGTHADICGMPRLRTPEGSVSGTWCDEEDFHDAVRKLFSEHILSSSVIFTGLAYDGVDRIETRITIHGGPEGISISGRRTRHSIASDLSTHIDESWPISISTHETSQAIRHDNIVAFSRGGVRT